MKFCTGCGLEKDGLEFFRRTASPDGLAHHCKPCKRKTDADYKRLHPAKFSAYGAAYYLANRDKKRAYDRVYYAANRDEIRAAAANWFASNRERARAARVLWRAAHPEAAAEWYKANRDKKLAHNRNRHALKKKAGGTHTAADIGKLLTLQRASCAGCKANLLQTGFEVDHIMPLARGGHNGPTNLQLLCQPCNGRKHAKHPVDFMQEIGYLL